MCPSIVLSPYEAITTSVCTMYSVWLLLHEPIHLQPSFSCLQDKFTHDPGVFTDSRGHQVGCLCMGQCLTHAH